MNNKGFSIIELLAILFIIFVVLIIGVAFYQEYSFGTKKGTVIDKRYNAAYTTYTTSYVNGSNINIPTIYPERWEIELQKDGQTLWVDVPESEYSEIKIGDCYNCN